ncbi:MAG: AAA family ATPase [Planctomycetes bacterium]|nr:AAA family ATPase [Planctomycetota bacterium]
MEAVLLIGIPASGKSSFYAARFAHSHVRVNRDMLRTPHREQELFTTLLRIGQPLVVDNTNVSVEQRQRFVAPARAAGFRVEGYYLASKLADCLPRNAAREGAARIPDVGVVDAASRLERPQLAEGFDRLYYVCMTEQGFTVEEWDDAVR